MKFRNEKSYPGRRKSACNSTRLEQQRLAATSSNVQETLQMAEEHATDSGRRREWAQKKSKENLQRKEGWIGAGRGFVAREKSYVTWTRELWKNQRQGGDKRRARARQQGGGARWPDVYLEPRRWPDTTNGILILIRYSTVLCLLPPSRHLNPPLRRTMEPTDEGGTRWPRLI